MSVHIIYYKDGAKMMRPVLSREEYLTLRDSDENRRADKMHMVQMNYSCLPTPKGTLKGSTQASTSVGMDIDFDPNDPDYEQKMASVPDMILAKKEDLGLLMLERSATKGYHIAFRRRPELTQEENLKWASALLGVAYDKGAKDITRVFFTPADRLMFIDDEIFEIKAPSPSPGRWRGVASVVGLKVLGVGRPAKPDGTMTGEMVVTVGRRWCLRR